MFSADTGSRCIVLPYTLFYSWASHIEHIYLPFARSFKCYECRRKKFGYKHIDLLESDETIPLLEWEEGYVILNSTKYAKFTYCFKCNRMYILIP